MQGKRAHESHFGMPVTVNSLEVEAAARDHAGAELPWPPRSYNCNFCHKGFESAQALGGHMNVHRREKARLTHYHMNSNSRVLHTSLQNRWSHINGDQNHTNNRLGSTLLHNPNTPKLLLVHPSSNGTPLTFRERKHSTSTPIMIFSILSVDKDDEATEKQSSMHRVVHDQESYNVLQSSSSLELKLFLGSKEDYLSCKKRQRRTQESVQSPDDLVTKTSSIARGDFDGRLQIAGFSKGAALEVEEKNCLDLELRLGHVPQL